MGRPSHLGDAEITLRRARRDGDLLSAEVRYGVDGRSWVQTFTARILDEAALVALLDNAGLKFGGWLPRPGWFSARPRQGRATPGSSGS